MKEEIFKIIALFIFIAAGIFMEYIWQHPESTVARWLHDAAAPAITNTIKNIIKAIPFSGLINWQ